MTEGQLVCIAAEEDMIVAISSGTPYVEADEKAMECSFRSLEFVNTMYVGEGTKVPVPKLSESTHSGIRQVPDKGARVGKGLGKRLQGMLRPITVIQKKWDTSPIGMKGKDSSKRRGRRGFLVSSGKMEIAQNWTYHH